MVLLLLPLSLAMDDSKFDHAGGGGGGGGPAAAAVAAVAAMDNNWRQKQLATRALMVAKHRRNSCVNVCLQSYAIKVINE